MAAAGGKSQAIIIKRIKKGGHGAHGGAWKIAYADFVTAMMAFFLLMWLLSATTDEEKEKLSEYFQQPIDVALFGDTGSGAASLLDGSGKGVLSAAEQQAVADQARMQLVATLRSERERADFARLEKLRRKVENAMLADPKLEESLSQLKLAITTEGLRIQIFDEENRAMFDSGSAVARPQMRALLRQLGAVLTQVPNQIAIEGHTDGVPHKGRGGYSNWELSSDRANASRRELVEGGLPEDRIMRVQGMASTDLLEKDDPKSAGNRRIVIVVLTLDAEEDFLQDAAKASGMMVDSVPGSTSEPQAKADSAAESAAEGDGEGAASPHAH